MQLEPHLDVEWLKDFPPEHRMLLHIVGSGLGPVPPTRIGVAVSGGGDSMALLHLLSVLSRRAGWDLNAVTIDHQMRAEAATEAAFVNEFCAGLGIGHETIRWNGKAAKGNFHKAARDARYLLIADWATARKLDVVALGHTADDIAENFLIRLQRKSGIDGLAAMDPMFDRNGIRWVRPLWQQERAELRQYLMSVGVEWIEDPSNDDPKYTRTQVRKALEILHPLGIDQKTLLHVSSLLSHESKALKHATLMAGKKVEQVDGDVLIPFFDGDVHPEIQQRLLKSALKYVSGSEYAPKAAKLTELDMTLHAAGKATLSGCFVNVTSEKTVSDKNIRVTREYNAVKDITCKTTELWDGRWRIDGPHEGDLEVRALGDGILQCPDWRETGHPRNSLRSSPSIWRGNTLIAAPLAGFNPKWRVWIEKDFQTFLLSH